MDHSDVTAVKRDPKRLLDFLREQRYAVYHRSNIFFRDFQHGLWRYLKENQTKVPYAAMEKIAREVIDAWEERGTLRRINRQSFELNMPEYITVWPTAEDDKTATAPPKGKPAPASGPAATEQPAAVDASDREKAAKIAELKEKTGADPANAAKIAELQARMAAARARREAGSAAGDGNGIGEERPSAEQEIPNTRARSAGEQPAAGRISPAEKSEPSGVPLQEQRHNADPNAPQSRVTPPGRTETPESATGGVPATSMRQGPDPGSDEARERAQVPAVPPPPDAGEGSARQENEPGLPGEPEG